MKFLFVDLWPWWFAGIAIGLLVPLMYYFLNTALGVSTGYGNFLKIIRPKSKLKWLNSDTYKDRFNWRFIFITGMRLLKARGNKDVNGREIQINRKSLNKYTVIGGILFGIGWAVSGACPGTVLAQIGEGKILGLFTFLGMLFGTYLYALKIEKSSRIE